MATALLPTGGIALVGAPDGDIESKNTTSMTVQAMQVEITQDIVDELIESIRGGHSPQLLFGKAPQLKYGDKSHVLQSNLESHRFELYRASRPDARGDSDLEFAGLINHSLIVQEAEDVTAGVDSALEQLRNNMAAISEIKEANKTIVGEATPIRTPSYGGHRRFPSTGFKAQHLAPSKLGSPLLSAPSSPMHKRPPTSQPSSSRDMILNALRMPVIHLLAREPATEAWLADTCRTSLGNVRELLPKIAKRITPDGDRWQLTDKAFRDIDPYKFPYPTSEDREQAIDAAIRAFDRQRLAKDDRLWQVLLPRSERGQGICLSRSKVKPPEAKASTPIHKISDLTKKKPTGKKADERAGGKKTKMVREVEAVKVKSVVKEKESRPVTKREVLTPKAPASVPRLPAPAPVPSSRSTPPIEPSKVRLKKGTAGSNTQDNSGGNNNSSNNIKSNINHNSTSSSSNSSSDGKPKMSARPRPARPAIPVNTKPKNPSPLSASPPLNASDFEDNPPVHKALAAASSSASTRAPKRKAKDIESLAVKKPHHSPASVKRKSDESSSSNTPTVPVKVRKVTHIDTGLASRYHHNNPQASPGASSTSTTSPSVPSLSFRQTVELSQRFQKYYKKYEELYWQLTESEKPPSKAQRDDLWKMHKKLEEMKKEIKAGAVVQH